MALVWTIELKKWRTPYAAMPLALVAISGVARLGHTGARALATRGRAPPVQICIRTICADSIVVDPESGAKRTWNRTAQYHPQNYESRTLTVRRENLSQTPFNASASLVPRPRGRREKWPGIHCLRMREKPHDFMGYRIPSFTNR